MTDQYAQTSINLGSVGDSRFRVGPPGSGAPFSSIQAAIDVAALESPSISEGNPIVIQIEPGIYEEDVAAGAGIALLSTFDLAVVVVGTITFDLSQEVVLDNGAAIEGLIVEPPAGSPALILTGSNNQNVLCFRCQFAAQGAPVVISNNTSGSFVDFSECSFDFDGGGSAIQETGGGFISLSDVEIFGPPNVESINIDNSLIRIVDSSIEGSIALVDGFCQIERSSISSSGAPPIRITTPGSNATVVYGALSSFGTGGVLADGVGVLSLSSVVSSVDAPTSSFDPALTVFRVLENGAENIQYDDMTAAAWSAPAPTNVNEAINRIANALSAEIGGPIP